jgi:type II secretory pathway pseudopilin PulG
LNSFSLVELLSVIAIITVLAALALGAGSAMMNKGLRSRASAEISGMGQALENYKVDNGAYPVSTVLNTSTYAGNDGSQAGGLYQQSSTNLFFSLAGTNVVNAPAATGLKSYYTFRIDQAGNPTSGAYVKDPWGYSYGYSTGGGGNAPYTGTNFYDLWSTGGAKTGSSVGTNIWISNWNQ